jgi:hypothetical protein
MNFEYYTDTNGDVGTYHDTRWLLVIEQTPNKSRLRFSRKRRPGFYDWGVGSWRPKRN